jgi:hypothetical protein
LRGGSASVSALASNEETAGESTPSKISCFFKSRLTNRDPGRNAAKVFDTSPRNEIVFSCFLAIAQKPAQLPQPESN